MIREYFQGGEGSNKEKAPLNTTEIEKNIIKTQKEIGLLKREIPLLEEKIKWGQDTIKRMDPNHSKPVADSLEEDEGRLQAFIARFDELVVYLETEERMLSQLRAEIGHVAPLIFSDNPNKHNDLPLS